MRYQANGNPCCEADGTGKQRLPGTWGTGEDDAVADGLGADAQEEVGVPKG
jgi:hypothetical protein